MSMLRPAVLAAASIFIFTGCGTLNRTKPAPAKSQPIKVRFSTEALSGMSDLPIGTYRVPDSQVIISGHQKGGPAGLLFGVVGVAIQHGVNRAGGKDAVEEIEKLLKINLTADGQAAAHKLIATDAYAAKFREGSGPGPVLSISTAVVLTFVNDTDIKPYVILKATLSDPKVKDKSKNKPGWSTRYIASLQAPRPLAGDNSWTADSAAALNSAIAANLERATEVMLRDVSNPFPRNDAKLYSIEGHFPFVKPRLQTVGYLLGEDADSIYFIPKLGDVIVFAGVNIMQNSVTTHREFMKGDPAFRVVKTAEEIAKAKKRAKKKK
jgi:hypothetical protein